MFLPQLRHGVCHPHEHGVCHPHEREKPTQVCLATDVASIADATMVAAPSPMQGHALVPRMMNRQQPSPQEARGENQHHDLGEYLLSR